MPSGDQVASRSPGPPVTGCGFPPSAATVWRQPGLSGPPRGVGDPLPVGRPAGQGRRLRGEGELPPFGPVRTTPPERAVGVAHVGDPAAVAGELHVAGREAAQKRSEGGARRVVADQLAARARRPAQGIERAAVRTERRVAVASSDPWSACDGSAADRPPPRPAALLAPGPEGAPATPVIVEHEVAAVRRPATAPRAPSREERVRRRRRRPSPPTARGSSFPPGPRSGVVVHPVTGTGRGPSPARSGAAGSPTRRSGRRGRPFRWRRRSAVRRRTTRPARPRRLREDERCLPSSTTARPGPESSDGRRPPPAARCGWAGCRGCRDCGRRSRAARSRRPSRAPAAACDWTRRRSCSRHACRRCGRDPSPCRRASAGGSP